MASFDVSAFPAAHRQFVHEMEQIGDAPFVGFDDLRLRQHELEYKHEVRGTATRLLQLHKWESWIRSSPSRIFRATLDACGPSVSKNLMEVKKGDKGNSAAALFLADRERGPDVREALGRSIYHFFCGGGADPSDLQPRFEALRDEVGSLRLPQNWPWYAYLAWLLSPERYAPVRPRTFDRALKYFGSRHHLARNFSWESYAEYTALIAWIQERLRPIYGSVDLIGAHSFLFVVFYYPGDENPLLAREPNGRTMGAQPDFDTELSRRIADAERREMTGLAGEQIVYEAEQHRLQTSNRGDLAAEVRLVSADKTAVGYDILSFEKDGSERHIEVKATTNPRSSEDQFYVTENERASALDDPAWQIVRVWNTGATPEIGDLGNPFSHSEEWTITPNSWKVRTCPPQ